MSVSQLTSFKPSVIQEESEDLFRSPISSLRRPISKDKSEKNLQHGVSESSISSNQDNLGNRKEASLNKERRRNKHRKNPKSNRVNINLYNQSSEEMIPQPSQLQSTPSSGQSQSPSSSGQISIISDSAHWSLFHNNRICPLPHYITLSAILTFFPIVTFLRLPVLLKVSVILPTTFIFFLVIMVTHSTLFTCYDALSGLVNIIVIIIDFY